MKRSADSADTPRFIETLPRRGYRFIYPVNGAAEATGMVAPPRAWWSRRWVFYAAPLALLLGLVALNVGGVRDRLVGRPVAVEMNSIAVLPLRNLSADREQDYFAEGMTEALITQLGKIGALHVISHQSVLGYRGGTKSLPEIARELKVSVILEGTVLRSGDKSVSRRTWFRQRPSAICGPRRSSSTGGTSSLSRARWPGAWRTAFASS